MISFGDSLNDIVDILGVDDCFKNNHYFQDGNILIQDNNNHIEYIELRNDIETPIIASYEEFDLFKEKKENVLAFLEKKNQASLLQDGESYNAFNLGIEVSFALSKEDIEDIISNSKKDGVYEQMLEGIQKDIYRSEHIECIGLSY